MNSNNNDIIAPEIKVMKQNLILSNFNPEYPKVSSF
jgi:hypothetical protein